MPASNEPFTMTAPCARSGSPRPTRPANAIKTRPMPTLKPLSDEIEVGKYHSGKARMCIDFGSIVNKTVPLADCHTIGNESRPTIVVSTPATFPASIAPTVRSVSPTRFVARLPGSGLAPCCRSPTPQVCAERQHPDYAAIAGQRSTADDRSGLTLIQRNPYTARAIRPRRCTSSVVEHSLGKGEVDSSILSCSTTGSRKRRTTARCSRCRAGAAQCSGRFLPLDADRIAVPRVDG